MILGTPRLCQPRVLPSAASIRNSLAGGYIERLTSCPNRKLSCSSCVPDKRRSPLSAVAAVGTALSCSRLLRKQGARPCQWQFSIPFPRCHVLSRGPKISSSSRLYCQSREMSSSGGSPEEEDPAALLRDFYPFELNSANSGGIPCDARFPGTAVIRLAGILKRVQSLTDEDLSEDWQAVRAKLLWAGGLAQTHETAHAFSDDNHCDLTPMVSSVKNESNASGNIHEISTNNFLGAHITRNTLPIYRDEAETGSWSTCTNGCHKTPPHDVAHVQFSARIAFKLVWCPPTYDKFVLVDDMGCLLKTGKPRGTLPHISYRQSNYDLVEGGIYQEAAQKAGQE